MDKGINKLKSARVDGTNLLTLNQKVRKNNSSGYKGVSYSKKYNNYRAYLNLSRKQIYLGSFATAEEAYQARLEGEKKYYQPLLKSHAQDMDQ
ncbi:TPA: AP2 domain-containing protein [Streptococcus suis]